MTTLLGVLDLDFVRDRFPALDTPWALMDNAGGSAPCREVIDRVREHMERLPVQLGATYEASREASAAVDAGRETAAHLLGVEQDLVVLGASSTALVNRLARALRAGWREGDEVVVTNVDHETNVGAWRRLEETGIVVREWRARPDTHRLEPEDLDALLGERTRLVAFTHCSNIVGSITDAAEAVRRARAAGALTCVDAVAYAPHRRVDAGAIDADVYFFSLYKVYGPHVAAMAVRRDVLLAAPSPNHFFVPQDVIPNKMEPGGTTYELAASLVGVRSYLEALADHHGRGRDVDTAYELMAEHEEALVAPLLAFLADHPRVTIVGDSSPDRRRRVPTVSFTVEGRKSSEITALLDERQVAARYGHFYAYRFIEDLDLLGRDGVIRVSLVHYNASSEVSRLVEALGDVL